MANARVGAPCALSPGRPSVRAAVVVPGGRLAQAYDQVLSWLERARQRRQLAELGDHMLKDIGLTRADVEAETSKPFWRE